MTNNSREVFSVCYHQAISDNQRNTQCCPFLISYQSSKILTGLLTSPKGSNMKLQNYLPQFGQFLGIHWRLQVVRVREAIFSFGSPILHVQRAHSIPGDSPHERWEGPDGLDLSCTWSLLHGRPRYRLGHSSCRSLAIWFLDHWNWSWLFPPVHGDTRLCAIFWGRGELLGWCRDSVSRGQCARGNLALLRWFPFYRFFQSLHRRGTRLNLV